MALVPYTTNSSSSILQRFYTTERRFEFVNHPITIRQSWTDSGVAGVVWDAAIVLATYLQNVAATGVDAGSDGLGHFHGRTFLELGAGTGLAGMVACLLGGNVLITDTLKALECTRENVHRNIINKDLIRNCKVEELHWGKDLDKWKGSSWDFIIGADIVYIEETFGDLFDTLKLLTDGNKKTNIILSCRIRYERDVKFLKLLETEFKVEELLYDADHDVKIFQANRY